MQTVKCEVYIFGIMAFICPSTPSSRCAVLETLAVGNHEGNSLLRVLLFIPCVRRKGVL